MTQEEILQGNKLIAKFIGMKYDSNANVYEDDKNAYGLFSLKFHSSWDWLMPVVEKIENNLVNYSHEVVIFGEHCHINQGKTHDMGYSSKGSKIASTWSAVVDFIKWYNTQTK